VQGDRRLHNRHGLELRVHFDHLVTFEGVSKNLRPMSFIRRARSCGRRSEYEIVCASDNEDVCDPEFDGRDIKLHTKFEHVDYLPNLNLKKVDMSLAQLVSLERGFMEKQTEFSAVNEKSVKVTVDGFVEASFHRR
jgi:hypothetical protein